MTDRDYTEPTNKQLASFLSIYAKHIPGAEHLQVVSPAILEALFERHPDRREVALRHHRAFQKQIFELSEKILAGEIQCEHILRSGKRCPNYNQPGSHYCGLHQDEEVE